MEMARAIRREKELIGNRQGQRSDLTSAHDEPKLEGRWSEQISKSYDISEQHIRRLDKLNELIQPLQTLVDQGKLSIKAAEQLAYIS